MDVSISPQPKTEPSDTGGLFFSLIVAEPPSADALESTVKTLVEVLEKEMPESYEIIMMSGDAATLQKGTELANTYPKLRVFKYTGGTPIAAGWEQAQGNVLAVVDGDLSVLPATLPELVKDLKKGSDLAVTSQFQEKKSDGGEPDLSFLAIKKEAVPKLHESSKGNQLILEILGPENIKKMAGDKSGEAKNGHILFHLKNMMGI